MARILSLPNYLPRTCSILIIRKPEKYEAKKKILYLKKAKNKTRKKKKEKKKESKKDKNRAIFSGRRNLLIIQNHC